MLAAIARGLAIAGFLLVAVAAQADGKFYIPDSPRTGIPYQRALLAFDGKQQLLIIESNFDAGKATAAGWVVPVPAAPDVATLKAGELDNAYRLLNRGSSPRSVTAEILKFLFAAVLTSIPFGILLAISYANRAKPFRLTLIEVMIFLAATGVVASTALDAPVSRTEVISAQRIGDYDVRIVRGADASALVKWFRENGFAFGDADLAVVDGYAKRGWVFATARLDPGRPGDQPKLVPPLLLQFAASEAVYPMALTALSGTPVQLTLYVFAPYRVDAQPAMEVEFADATKGPPIKGLGSMPLQGLLRVGNYEDLYLTKFRVTLAPGQLQGDIAFKQAANNSSARWRW